MNEKILENKQKVMDEKILSLLKEENGEDKIRDELALRYLTECFSGYNFLDKCPIGITEYIPPKLLIRNYKLGNEQSYAELKMIYRAYNIANKRINQAKERAGLIKRSFLNKVIDSFYPNISD